LEQGCWPGDILFYDNPPNLSTHLIVDGEHLEDPGEGVYFYHVAIALDANDKAEADGKCVEINPIDYGKFIAFRPPLSRAQIRWGLFALRELVGERYDWWMIADDALRFITHNVIHLPASFILSSERHRKICNTLAAAYLEAAGWGLSELPRSPEDLYNALRYWPVRTD